MDVIEISGSRYVKASVAAKKKGYTADYVGQLCREGKIDATQVGRAWYVREDTLDSHKDSNLRSNKQKTLEAVSVEKDAFTKEYERGRIHQSLYAPQGSSSFRDRLLSTPISYGKDAHPLFPTLEKQTSATEVELAELAEENRGLEEVVELPVEREGRASTTIPVTIDTDAAVLLAVEEEGDAPLKPWSATIDLTDTSKDEIVFSPAEPAEIVYQGEIPVQFLADDDDEEAIVVTEALPPEPSPHVLSPFMGLDEVVEAEKTTEERALAQRPIMSLVSVATITLGLLLVVGSIFLQNVWVYQAGVGGIAERPYFETSYGITAVSTLLEAVSR